MALHLVEDRVEPVHHIEVRLAARVPAPRTAALGSCHYLVRWPLLVTLQHQAAIRSHGSATWLAIGCTTACARRVSIVVAFAHSLRNRIPVRELVRLAALPLIGVLALDLLIRHTVACACRPWHGPVVNSAGLRLSVARRSAGFAPREERNRFARAGGRGRHRRRSRRGWATRVAAAASHAVTHALPATVELTAVAGPAYSCSALGGPQRVPASSLADLPPG